MRIYSIFNSIDGEVNLFGQGVFTTFIRFAGCNLNCSYCDTKYALDIKSGKVMTVDQVVKEVKSIGCRKVTITGGEPLWQHKAFMNLTKKLWHNGFQMSVETNGSLPLEGYGISSWIVDYKLNSSGMMEHMREDVFLSLRPSDYIKFVIADETDWGLALNTVEDLRGKDCRAKMLFSPAFGICPPEVIIKSLQEFKMFDIQLNIQLHKYILPNEPK